MDMEKPFDYRRNFAKNQSLKKKSKDFGGFPSPKVREIVKITRFL